MRNMLRFLKGYEKESILAPLFKMLEACFELLVPLVVANIIDVGIKNRGFGLYLQAVRLDGAACRLWVWHPA